MATISNTKVFVPPYFFLHCKAIDPKNASVWEARSESSQQSINTRIETVVPVRIGGSVQQRSHLNLRPSVNVHVPHLRNGRLPILKDPNEEKLKNYGKAVFDFLEKVFNRYSFDNMGSSLTIYIHCKKEQVNAAFRPNNDTVHIGDGDGENFPSLLNDIDILAHEIAHAIIKYTARFNYHGESGALDESFADVFASMVKQYVRQQKAKDANWVIGDKFVRDLTHRKQALRSLKSPGQAYRFSEKDKDPQVEHMNYYVETQDDDGGVHYNSGIINKAFYNFAMQFPDQHSWETAGKIWFKATIGSRPTTTFQEFAQTTLKVAKSDSIKEKLQHAWAAVGINTSPLENARPVQQRMSSLQPQCVRHIEESNDDCSCIIL